MSYTNELYLSDEFWKLKKATNDNLLKSSSAEAGKRRLIQPGKQRKFHIAISFENFSKLAVGAKSALSRCAYLQLNKNLKFLIF